MMCTRGNKYNGNKSLLLKYLRVMAFIAEVYYIISRDMIDRCIVFYMHVLSN